MTDIIESVPEVVKSKSRRNYCFLAVALIIPFALIVLVLGVITADLQRSVGGALALLLPGTLVGIVAYRAYKIRLARFPPPTVTFSDGILTAYNAETMITSDIAECRVRRGFASSTNFPSSMRLFCFSTVIHIQIPRSQHWWQQHPIVAVGFTKRSSSEWEAMMKNYGVILDRKFKRIDSKKAKSAIGNDRIEGENIQSTGAPT